MVRAFGSDLCVVIRGLRDACASKFCVLVKIVVFFALNSKSCIDG